MAYSRVTRTALGAAALEYVLQDSGHNGAENRNEIVTAINMCSSIPYRKQMEKYWLRARANHKTQIIRVIQSFSKNEFDPNDPSDILKANMAGQKFADEHYPGRQILVCTQTDGKGRCVHNHILINDVSMIDCKGCTKEQYFHPSIRIWTDEAVREFTYLDCGKGNQYADKLTKAEKEKLEKGEYSWKEDLRNRIKQTMESALSEEDFINKLADNNVKAEKKYRKKHDDYYWLYELLDLSKISEKDRNKRRKFNIRDRNLGTDYGQEAVASAIETNKAAEIEKSLEAKDPLRANIEKIYRNIAAVFTEENGTADYSDLRKNDHSINSTPQNISSNESEEFDYVPSMKAPHNSEEKKIDNTSVYIPSYDDNSKINFNPPPLCFEDIMNDDELEDDKKERLHIAEESVEPKYVTSDNITDTVGNKSVTQSVSKESTAKQAPEPQSSDGIKASVLKPSEYGTAKTVKRKTPNIVNRCDPKRFDNVDELTKNIRYEKDYGNEFSR